MAMRIAPRTLLCASAFRVGGSGAETGFDELRALCEAAGDKSSLAIGMTGLITQQFASHHAEASDLATEQIRLFEAIDDPALTVGFAFGALSAKLQAGEVYEVLRLADRVVTLADGDTEMGSGVMGSPLAIGLAFRCIGRWAFGHPGWREDFRRPSTWPGTLTQPPSPSGKALVFEPCAIPRQQDARAVLLLGDISRSSVISLRCLPRLALTSTPCRRVTWPPQVEGLSLGIVNEWRYPNPCHRLGQRLIFGADCSRR